MRIRLFGHYYSAAIVMLAVCEALLFVAAMTAAVLLAFRNSPNSLWSEVADYRGAQFVFGPVAFISQLSLGLYTTRQRASVVGVGVRLVLAMTAAVAATTLLFYFFPPLAVWPGVLVTAAGLSLLGSAVLRLVFSRVSDGQAFKKLVLVYGSGPRAASFQALRRASDRRGFTLLGYVCPPEDPCLVPQTQVLDASAGLLGLCDQLTVDEIVIALEDRRLSLPVDELLTCRLAGIQVTDYVSFMERETGRIVLEALNPSWMIFGEGFRRGTLRTVTSRLLDILASLLILTLTLPLIALVAAGIWLEDGRKGGGVLYRQVRIGRYGKPFTLYKFRSMRANAEVAGKAQWAQRNDPRVTHLGGFLRKARIDELPQLFNVLRGDMSLVGPRPERPQFVSQLLKSIPYYSHRHAVKPGIAGWAQLCYPYGASEADARQKLQYDLYYVKNNSFLLDLAILLQTAEVVLMGKGAR